MPETAAQPLNEIPRSFTGKLSQNILASLVRVFVVALVSLVLPAFLTHHLPVTTYAAWVLIIQLGAYVSYLDLGIQTGVSKFVAEFDARGDIAGAGRHASAGLTLMFFTGVLGLLLTCGLAWRVPRLFHGMPADLYHEVRVSVLLIGASLSFGLVCAVYSAVFLGLQRYWIPMSITIANRVSYAVVVVVIVALRGSLEAMGIAVALINIATGILQVIMWTRKASPIRLSVRLAGYPVLKKVVRYCSLQSIWTFGMLCVSGLDITIVGHYDYSQTAYYSIATLPTSFVLLLISSMVNPLMPASSAMSTQLSPDRMGDFLARTTRYTTILLLLSGLPLVLYGFPLLRFWVGQAYAVHTLRYLQILVVANVIRNLCLPYATMISATGRQGAATATALSEAIVNLGSSIYFASRFGAIGVALGTLLGSFLSVLLHFSITMHFTHNSISIPRARLFLNGLLRPAATALPSVVLFPVWWRASESAPSPAWAVVWILSTLALTWRAGLTSDERNRFMRICEAIPSAARTLSP